MRRSRYTTKAANPVLALIVYSVIAGAAAAAAGRGKMKIRKNSASNSN